MADAEENGQRFGLLPDVPVGPDAGASEVGESDLLDRATQIRILAEAAVNTPNSITLGIYGDWGAGKTSAMALMREYIDKETDAITVWFNAWRYEREEHLLVPLMATVLEDIKVARMQRKGFFRTAGGTVLLGAVKMVHSLQGAIRATKVKVESPSVPGLPKASLEFDPGKAAEIEEALNKALDETIEGGIYFEAFRQLHAVTASTDGLPRIVIFIDDLDRCLSSKAMELLENIKLVLDLPNVAYVIGLAEGVIERLLREKFSKDGGMTSEDAAQYLHKLIQVPFTLTSPTPAEMERYVGALIENESIFSAQERKELSDLLPILTTITENNPRSVVRFINPLIVLNRVSRAKAHTAGKGKDSVPLSDLVFASALRKARDALSRLMLVIPQYSETDEPKSEKEQVYRSFNWPESFHWPNIDGPRHEIFPEAIAVLLTDSSLFDRTDPDANQFEPRLQAMADVQTHPGAAQALRFLAANLRICSALSTKTGVNWLRSAARIHESFVLIRNVKSEELTKSVSEQTAEDVDWAKIEELVTEQGVNPLTIPEIRDPLLDGDKIPEFARPFVADLSPLDDSRRPGAVMADWTKLGEVSSLSAPKPITWLDFTGCKRLVHLTPLADHTKLTVLILDGCAGVTDLVPLKGLTALEHVSLIGCTGVTDIAPLMGLTALRRLDLDGCTGVTDLAPLDGLTALIWLHLRGCTGVTDIPPLGRLTALTRLRLDDCTGVTDLAPLAGLTTLARLDLNDCTGVTDLTPLYGLTALDSLDLTGRTGATDLAPLCRLASLRRVRLQGCTGLPKEQVAWLREALPHTHIFGP